MLPPRPREHDDPWFVMRDAWDAAVETELEGRLSPTSLAPLGVAAAQGFGGLVRMMQQRVADMRWLNIGDSLSANWPGFLRDFFNLKLPVLFPELRLEYSGWVHDTGWEVPSVVYNPNSWPNLRLHNMALPGKNLAYVQGGSFRWQACVDLAPHAVSICHGFNDASDMDQWRSRLVGLVAAVRADMPDAEILIIAQNPHRDQTLNTLRMIEAAKVARLFGAGFADLTTPFLLSPDFESLFESDGVHPNAAGIELMSSTMTHQFATGGQVRPAGDAGLGRAAPTILPAGLFLDWTGSGMPPGTWIENATAVKNTADWETGGFSVQCNAAAAGAYITLAGGTGKPFRNRWVTVAARVKTLGASARLAGYAEVSDGVKSVNAGGDFDADAAGAWRWTVAHMRIDKTSTFLGSVVRLTSGNVTNSTVLIDRIITCVGATPHDALR